jgi:hypothetical protein
MAAGFAPGSGAFPSTQRPDDDLAGYFRAFVCGSGVAGRRDPKPPLGFLSQRFCRRIKAPAFIARLFRV